MKPEFLSTTAHTLRPNPELCGCVRFYKRGISYSKRREDAGAHRYRGGEVNAGG